MLHLASLRLEGVEVQPHDEGVSGELARLAARLRVAYRDLAVGSVPGVEEARSLYRALGIDPTRTRPASEALLRRALRDQPLPAVNAAVDAGNLLSLERLLPVGLYDASLLRGEVVARLGAEGEGYEGIRKEWISLRGRVALCDADGPFGNPSADARRTAVEPGCRALLFVLYAPASRPAALLWEDLAAVEQRFLRHVGGTVTERRVLA